LSLRDYINEEHYQYLKQLLNNHLDWFNEEEQSDLFTFAYNYCILRINQGHSSYQEELFHLYEQGIDTSLVFQHGVITEWNYKNIATLGAKLKKFKWTEDFITKYKEYLPKHHQENVYNYNLAYLYYSKGNYEKVLDHLLHVQYTDVKYHLSSSYLLVRTYHKLGNTEALLSLLDTFRLFVMRNKQMTGSQKKEYINFIRLAKKLVILKHDYHIYTKAERQKKFEKLLLQIQSTDPLINRSWLVEECVEEPVGASA
jgi:tetratricopeptide (TPR) repeat protein